MASGTRVRWAIVALAVLAPVAAAVTSGGSPAGATRAVGDLPPTVHLLYETPSVSQDHPALRVSVSRSGPALGAGSTVQLTLYSRLTTRSALDESLAGTGPSGAVSTTGRLSAACFVVGPQLQVTLPVEPDGTAAPPRARCGPARPLLRLGCSADCDGVYPLRVTVAGGGSTSSLVTLVTYASASTTPLRVVWVVRVAEPGPTTSTPAPAGGLAGALGALRALAAHPRVPVTVDVEGSAVAAASGASGAAGVAALRAAVQGSSDELVTESYVPADLGALRASGLRSEVDRQFALDRVALATVGVTATPSPSVTYGTGPQTPTSADAAATVGYHHLLVDGGALAQDPVSTLDWGYAFHVAGAPAGPTALASDTELSAQSDATSTDPGLVASQLLGELAFLHFEEPDLVEPRAAVVVTTATSAVTRSFAAEVLAGLAHNPVLQAVTASSAFREVPVGTGGFPSVRSLSLPASRPLDHATTSLIAFLRTTTDALSSAIKRGVTPIPSIEGDLLSAEQVLGDAERTSMLDHVHQLLADQLGYFRIYDGTITLTEAGATLPITVFSTAPYTVRATLVLSSAKLAFPAHEGKHSTHLVVTLSGSSVASVPVPARALVTGDLPMSAVLVSPSGHLVLAHALITVRATGTSVVGIVLTVVALLVLAIWWARTSRRRRAAR